VKSVNGLLKKEMDQHLFTAEELFMTLKQIEATLNSRPLVPLYSPPEDGVQALTPGHFLVGRPLTAFPEKDLNTSSLLPSNDRTYARDFLRSTGRGGVGNIFICSTNSTSGASLIEIVKWGT